MQPIVDLRGRLALGFPASHAAIFLLAILAFVLAGPLRAVGEDAHLVVETASGPVDFTVELALTPQEQARGLMFRNTLAERHGMLFDFGRPREVTMWMKNTLIPLDMLFIDARGIVQTVHANAVPMDRTPIDGGENILYVLEINGGMAARLHLEPGAELRHPAITPALAAWPCD